MPVEGGGQILGSDCWGDSEIGGNRGRSRRRCGRVAVAEEQLESAPAGGESGLRAGKVPRTIVG